MLRLLPSMIVVALVIALSPPALAQSEVVHEFSTSVAASGIERVIVEMPEAGITIRTAAGEDVSATGRVRRGFRNDKQRRDAQAMVDDASIEIVVDGTTATVRRAFGPNAMSRSAKGSRTAFEFVLIIPETKAIRVRMSAGEVDASGLLGHVDIGLRAGDVKLTMPKASVKELIARARLGGLDLNLGDRLIEKDGILAGKAHYLNEGGAYVVSVLVTAGDVKIELTR
ncbi:MAG: hypothetical protein ACSLFQ_12655 [Thermoanaerobaculia bacterium]